MHATILAAIAKAPENNKRQLVSKVPERRNRAEDVIAASIVVELSQQI